MTIRPQCFLCVHLTADGGRPLKCDAFPEAIPTPILLNEHDHREPYEGDHGIRFQAAPGETPDGSVGDEAAGGLPP